MSTVHRKETRERMFSSNWRSFDLEDVSTQGRTVGYFTIWATGPDINVSKVVRKKVDHDILVAFYK